MEQKKKLVRSANRVFGGVLGGLAEYFGIDPTVVRVCYVLLAIFSAGFPGLLVYIILLLIMPEKGPNDDIEEAEVVK